MRDEPSRSAPSGTSELGRDPTHLIVGRVLAPWGYRGQVRVEILTDFPERFGAMREIVAGPDMTVYHLQAARLYRGQVLLKLEGIDSPEQAAALLQGQYLYVPVAEAMPLGPDQYYHYQILGLDVFTDAGWHLGRIVDILETGANDVYVVDADGREVLIPAVAHVVREVNLEQRRLIITPIPGLIDEEEA
ncbi:MAG: ribosome maturation factor RimM [Anaerolineae bacterium]